MEEEHEFANVARTTWPLLVSVGGQEYLSAQSL